MRIAWEDEAGRLHVHTITPEGQADMKRTLLRLGVADRQYIVVQEGDLPSDLFGIDAWRLLNGRLVLDMHEARRIHMGRIRAVRARALADLDVRWSRAMDQGDLALAAEIGRQRQVLRDLPQTYDLTRATSPEALAKMWPPELADWIS